MIEALKSHMPYLFFAQFSPLLMVVAAIVLLILGHVVGLSNRLSFLVVSACLLVGWAFLLSTDDGPHHSGSWGFSFDGISRVGLALIMPAALIVILMAALKKEDGDHKTTSLLLILISLLGGMVTLISSNWMVTFVGLQCMSIPIYGLLAYNTDDKLSIMASVRYLVLSGLAMAFLLFGIVMLYAATGSMDFFTQSQKIMELTSSSLALLLLGFALILVGLAFKMSLVPFHIWAPDVYQGASLFVTGYLVIILKGVVIFFLLRNFALFFAMDNNVVTLVFSVMAISSMWLGNGLMLVEKNMLRLLAYLSIGHLGALMIPLLAKNSLGAQAICIDLIAFGLAIFLLLGSLKLFFGGSYDYSIEDMKGLAHKNPGHALVLAVALISLAGVPLTAGFIGKYTILMAGTEANMWHLIIHMALSSIFGIFALARIVVFMMQVPSPLYKETNVKTPLLSSSLLCVGAFFLLVMGIFPGPLLSWVLRQIH